MKKSKLRIVSRNPSGQIEYACQSFDKKRGWVFSHRHPSISSALGVDISPGKVVWHPTLESAEQSRDNAFAEKFAIPLDERFDAVVDDEDKRRGDEDEDEAKPYEIWLLALPAIIVFLFAIVTLIKAVMHILEHSS